MSEASPRFRQDLATSPVEADGVACVDVRDPKTGASFRFYDFEYQLALQLNGQPVTEVVSWASQVYGAELTPAGVAEFATRLGELGFLEREAFAAAKGADAVATLEVPIPKSPAADEGGESAADEWLSAQSAQTAQFIPDAEMLAAPEPTPVAPLPVPPREATRPDPPAKPATLAKTVERPVVVPPAEGDGVPDKGVAGEATVPVSVDDLDARAGASAADVPTLERPVVVPPGALSGSPRATPSSWVLALDGDLQPPGATAGQEHQQEKQEKKDVGLPPVPAAKVAPPPPGVAERRQPPAPDAVVMAAFSGDAAKGEERRRGSRAPLIIGLALAAAAVAAGVWYWKKQHPAAAPQAIRVHVLTPSPAAVYRWFERPGQVTAAEVLALSFSTAGRLTEMLPSGTELKPGDVVGKLQAAAPIEAALEHHRSRIGFYKQVRDAMRTVGNGAAAHHAEVMLAEKERLAADAQTALARYTIVAREPGEIIETLAKVGGAVGAGTPVVRVKSRLLRGAFQLEAAERSAFASLDFCRVEVIGLGPRASNEPERRVGQPATAVDSSPLEAQVGPRFVDCARLPPVAQPDDPIQVALPGDVGLVSGQPLRLARRRFDGVFPIPASAVLGDGDSRAVWVAAHDGTAESRPVVLADAAEEALVSEGLRVGDQVVVDPPADLRAGSRLAIAP